MLLASCFKQLSLLYVNMKGINYVKNQMQQLLTTKIVFSLNNGGFLKRKLLIMPKAS